jgi:hypothetical protein
MLRIAALLGAAMALGTFGATLTHHLRGHAASGPLAMETQALGGLAGFVAGLVWLAVGLTLFLQRPHGRAERALYVSALAAAVHFFLEAGGASTLPPGFGLARDSAAVLAALGLAALANFVTAPSRRFATLAALVVPLPWLLLPRSLAWLTPALAALLVALRGRQRGRAFTLRQQATWLTAGLAALVAGGLAAAALAPLGLGWTRDLAALLSLAVPFTAALSLQKVALLQADRIVARLGVASVLISGALIATQVFHGALAALPADRRALLSGAFALSLLLGAARLRDPVAARLLDLLFPERMRLRPVLADAPEALVDTPFEAWAARIAAQLKVALGRSATCVWRVDARGHLFGMDDQGHARRAGLRPHGRLWALASVFGAPLSADDLAGVPLEPVESRWLVPGAPRVLLPIVFDDRPVGFLELLGPPLSDEAWRSLAEFAAEVCPPFAAAALRAECAAEAAAHADAERLRDAFRRSRDARMVQRALHGVAGHLRRRAALDATDAAEAGRQLGVCEAMLSEAAAWELPLTRRLVPLGHILDRVVCARGSALRNARIELHLDPALDEAQLFVDPDALFVVLLTLLDDAIGVLSGFAGPRVIEFTGGPAPEAPGFLRLGLSDSGPARSSPGSEAAEAMLAPLLRSLGARRQVETRPDANVNCIELPMTGY